MLGIKLFPPVGYSIKYLLVVLTWLLAVNNNVILIWGRNIGYSTITIPVAINVSTDGILIVSSRSTQGTSSGWWTNSTTITTCVRSLDGNIDNIDYHYYYILSWI